MVYVDEVLKEYELNRIGREYGWPLVLVLVYYGAVYPAEEDCALAGVDSILYDHLPE